MSAYSSGYRFNSRSPYRRRKSSGGTGKVAGAVIGLFIAYSLTKAAVPKAAAHPHTQPSHQSQVTVKVKPKPKTKPKKAPAVSPQDAHPTGNAALGESLAAAYGWTGPQWSCLDSLWWRESGWQNDIANQSSGAFGIAQALGHGGNGTAVTVAVVRYPDGSVAYGVTVNEYPSAAANAGNARAQIVWGLAYIAETYGTPCGAWAHEVANSWY